MARTAPVAGSVARTARWIVGYADGGKLGERIRVHRARFPIDVEGELGDGLARRVLGGSLRALGRALLRVLGGRGPSRSRPWLPGDLGSSGHLLFPGAGRRGLVRTAPCQEDDDARSGQRSADPDPGVAHQCPLSSELRPSRRERPLRTQLEHTSLEPGKAVRDDEEVR